MGGNIFGCGVDSTSSDLPILLRGQELAYWDAEPVASDWAKGVGWEREEGQSRGCHYGWMEAPMEASATNICFCKFEQWGDCEGLDSGRPIVGPGGF